MAMLIPGSWPGICLILVPKRGSTQDPTSGPATLIHIRGYMGSGVAPLFWGPVLDPVWGPLWDNTGSTGFRTLVLDPLLDAPTHEDWGFGADHFPSPSAGNAPKWGSKWALNAQFWSPRGTTPTGCWTP